MSKNSKGNNDGGLKRHGTWHHVISTYVGGPDVPKNKYRWLKKKHEAWHELFHHYLPSVVIEIIKTWTGKDGNLVPQKIGRRGIRAWHKVFNGGTPEQANLFIEKKFLPIEKKFLKGELK